LFEYSIIMVNFDTSSRVEHSQQVLPHFCSGAETTMGNVQVEQAGHNGVLGAGCG
jgi:hypothetical protein